APGTGLSKVSGVDGASNTVSKNYSLSTVSVSKQPTFDDNGNMTFDGANQYLWDAENRLIQINYPGAGNNSQFTYDGMGQCVKIVETQNNVVTSTKQLVWEGGDTPEESRSSTGAVTAQYFSL